MAGMSMEKYKALEHPYPTLAEKIKKYGYDPKQLHHILRMNEFTRRYISGETYEACLKSKIPKYLIDVKRGCHSLDEARKIAKEKLDETIEMKNVYMNTTPLSINRDVENLMNGVLINVLKKSFVMELEV